MFVAHKKMRFFFQMVVARWVRHFLKMVVARWLWAFVKTSGFLTETLWQACIDELENLHGTEQLYVLSHDRSWGRGWVPVKPV